MRIAKTESHVDPQKQFAYIVVWTVFNLLGVLGFLILLVVGLLSRRLRQNPILISFYANFAVACFGNAFLSVSGYVFKEVPYGICVVSGAFGVSVSLLQTTAALALVLKVWSHALMINQPRSTLLQAISSSSVLVAAPWVIGAPFFIAACVMGAQDFDVVSRNSPLYCSINNIPLNAVMLVIDAAWEIGAVILAIWTATLVARSRWRAQAMRNRGGVNYYSLTIRTLAFTVLLTVAFALSVAISLVSFSNPIIDMISSALFVLAVILFMSDPVVMKMLFRCRDDTTPVVSQANASLSVSVSVSHQTRRDGPLHSPGGARFKAAPDHDHELESMHDNKEWKSVAPDSSTQGRDEYALPQLTRGGGEVHVNLSEEEKMPPHPFAAAAY